MPLEPVVMTELDLGVVPAGARVRATVPLTKDGLGHDIGVPLLILKGKRPGPVLGLTAALHGNELNGVFTIHRLFESLEGRNMAGAVVAVVVANVPGFHREQREYSDGTDLNDILPGKEGGTPAEVYGHRLMDRVIRHFDALLDLHTASFGRVNSLYVRADLTHEVCRRLAHLVRPQIILHNPPSDGTLRGAAMDLGLPAITVEIADPQRFQPGYVRSTLSGLRSVLADFGIVSRRRPAGPAPDPVVCDRSYWLRSDRGGLLEVYPELRDELTAGERIAVVRDAWGDVLREYDCPEAGIVIGKSVNPVSPTGSRILHLGVVAPQSSPYWLRPATPDVEAP